LSVANITAVLGKLCCNATDHVGIAVETCRPVSATDAG